MVNPQLLATSSMITVDAQAPERPYLLAAVLVEVRDRLKPILVEELMNLCVGRTLR
jgi:hypothetical protein